MNNNISKVAGMKLDLLRGLSAQAVLIEHILTTTGKTNVFIGSFGVVIFFILSGFLIHLTTLNSFYDGKFALEKYLSKRFFRIFTLYVPVVILCFAIDSYIRYLGLPQPEEVVRNSEIKNFFASFFMLQQNIFSEVCSQLLSIDAMRIKPYGSARPLWTVAIEWWIYIAYGYIFAFVFAKQKLPKIYTASGLLLCFAIVIVIFNAISGIGHNLTFIWILGAVAAHAYSRGATDWFGRISGKNLKIISVAALILFAARLVHMKLSPMFSYQMNPYDFVNVVIFMSLFLILVARDDWFDSWPILNKLSIFFGNISYSLYLIHFTILSALFSFGWLSVLSLESFALAFCFSNAVAIVLYLLLDKHHQKLNRLFWKYFPYKNPKIST